MVYCSQLGCLIIASEEFSIRMWGPDWELRVAFEGHNGKVIMSMHILSPCPLPCPFMMTHKVEMLCFFVSRCGELTVLLPCIKHAVISLCGLYNPLLECGRG